MSLHLDYIQASPNNYSSIVLIIILVIRFCLSKWMIYKYKFVNIKWTLVSQVVKRENIFFYFFLQDLCPPSVSLYIHFFIQIAGEKETFYLNMTTGAVCLRVTWLTLCKIGTSLGVWFPSLIPEQLYNLTLQFCAVIGHHRQLMWSRQTKFI